MPGTDFNVGGVEGQIKDLASQVSAISSQMATFAHFQTLTFSGTSASFTADHNGILLVVLNGEYNQDAHIVKMKCVITDSTASRADTYYTINYDHWGVSTIAIPVTMRLWMVRLPVNNMLNSFQTQITSKRFLEPGFSILLAFAK